MTIKAIKPALNIREELNELKQDTGLKGQELMRADTVAEARALIGAGRKNLIINGDFRVSQRGTYTSVATFASGAYSLDRWKAYRANITGTFQTVSTTIDGVSKTALRVVATNNVSGELAMQQRLENQDIPNGSTVTLSAWVKSDTNAGLRYNNGALWSGITPHSGSGEWEKLSVTFVASNAASYYSVQLITFIPSTNSYFEFTEVQLEVGSVATEFEHRSYGEELALCQRYYYNVIAPTAYHGFSLGFVESTNLFKAYVKHPVTMRAIPTLTTTGSLGFYGGTHKIASAISGTAMSKDGGELQLTVAAATVWRPGRFEAIASVGASYRFDAEL